MRSKLAERLCAPGLRLGALPWGSRIALGFLLMVIGCRRRLRPGDRPARPARLRAPRLPPGAEHWFGTDRQGRDIFSRLLYGARSSLVIGLGADPGRPGRRSAPRLDRRDRPASGSAETLMRLMDILMAFPGIALAAVLVAVFGRSFRCSSCDRLHLHPAAGPRGPRQRARPVRRGLRPAERVMGAAAASSPSTSSATASPRCWCSPR